MRTALAAVLLLAVVACKGGAPAEPPPAPRDRPLAPDGSAARAVTAIPDRARVELDLAAVRAALQNHRGVTNAWPASLAELGVSGLSYPADLAYDPAAGTVRSQTYPGL